MLQQRFASAIILTLLCALNFPQLALATQGADKSMTSSVISQADTKADAFADLAKAWSKAAPGSPEADALAQKGAAAYASLETYVTEQLKTFEERRKWYVEKGLDYTEGKEFMEAKTMRLQRFLNNAQQLDLYKHLKK